MRQSSLFQFLLSCIEQSSSIFNHLPWLLLSWIYLIDLDVAKVLKSYFYGKIHLENEWKSQFVSSLSANTLSLCFLECKWTSQYVLGNKLERSTNSISLCFKKCILVYGSLHFHFREDNEQLVRTGKQANLY